MCASEDLAVLPRANALTFCGRSFPGLIAAAGENATRRFIEFFTANIRNANTRAAYAQAVSQFLSWSEARKLALPDLSPFIVAAYVEELGQKLQAPSVKQHLAAVRMLFDWLVIGQVIPMNPASSVRGPKHVVKKGKTPVLSAEDARMLLDSIPLTRKVRQEGETRELPDLVGLRDRATIAVMVYSFARIGAVCGMEVGDYYQNGKRFWFRLHEKGGIFHEVPAHHNAEAYLDAYLEASGIGWEKKTPLFRSARGTTGELKTEGMTRNDAFRMIKRRAKAAGLPERICCYTFRATGITAYLEAGGTIENAQAIAAHEPPRTTKLYDRTNDQISLDEVERIVI